MSATLLIWARAFHFGSGMILVGVMAFRWLVLLPAFAGETDEAWQKFAPLFRKLHALFIGSGIILVLSGFLLFWAVAAGMSDLTLTESLSPDTLGTVFWQTQFGSVFQWRIGLAVILAMLIGWLAWNQWCTQCKSSSTEFAAGLIAIALTVSMAWTGHAAAAGGPSFYARVLADATHLFAVSIWPTGLLPFALFLGYARRINDASRLQPALAVARRFSTVSFLAVWVLIASGIINACFIIGSFEALFTTDYGRLLCLKLFLFLLMLGIASWNRYRLLPLLLLNAETSQNSLVYRLLHRLQNFVLTEFGLAVAIVIVASILGTTPPPR